MGCVLRLLITVEYWFIGDMAGFPDLNIIMKAFLFLFRKEEIWHRTALAAAAGLWITGDTLEVVIHIPGFHMAMHVVAPISPISWVVSSITVVFHFACIIGRKEQYCSDGRVTRLSPQNPISFVLCIAFGPAKHQNTKAKLHYPLSKRQRLMRENLLL